jgi:hypothetical protein
LPFKYTQSFTTEVKIVQKNEIRAYIKARSKLGCSLKQLMTELSISYGLSCVSYDTGDRKRNMSLV